MSKAEKQTFVVRTPADARRAAAQIAELEVEERNPLVIEVKPHKVLRSEKQNRYLWGWLYRNIAKQLDEAGVAIDCDDGRRVPYDPDILHEIFKEKFLCYAEISRTNKITGEVKTRKLCYSTTQLVKHMTSPEDEARCFSTYVNNIKNFAHEFWGITIPPTWNEELLDLDEEVRQAA